MQFKHNKYISKSIISGFLTILILIILFFVSNYYNKQNNILYNNIKSIENKLHLLEKETINILNNTVERLNKNPDTNPFDNTYILQSLCDNGISLYAFYNDSLVYWTDNHVPLPEYSDFITNDTSLISQLKNGFYEIRSSKQPPWTITAYILIKSNYKYQNEYLTNSFNNKLNIPENTELSLSKNNINIYSYDNKFLFSLNKTGKFSYSSKISILIFVLYILFYCVLLYFIYCILNIFSKIKTNNNIFLIIYTVLLIFTRFVFYKYKILSPLYDTIIFSPQLYASSIFLPSLGDLFLTILTVIFIVLAFYNKLYITADNKKIQIIITIFSLIFYLALFGFFHYIIKSLVIDSSITLNPDNIFNLDIFSLLAYFIIIILIFLLTVAILKIYNLIFYNNEYFKQNFIVFISLVALFFIINLFTYLIDIKFITAFTVIFLTIIISYRLLNNDKITVKIFIAFALFSAYSTIILSQNFKIKEQEKRKLLALKLAKEKDPVAEYLFQQISTNILHDEEINELLHKTSYDENIISNKILEKYFDKYWDNFNIQLTFCNKYDKLNVQPFAVNVNCQDFFNSLVKDSIYSTTDKNLFYVDYGNSYKGYLGIINFNNKKNDINNSITLYIEFKPKFILKGLGLPELFVYQKTGFNTELADYSYAFYKSGTLIESYGKFIYPTCLSLLKNDDLSNNFIDKNDYNHFVYKIEKDSKIVISRKNDDIFCKIAPFTYLLILLCIFALPSVFLLNYGIKGLKFKPDFRQRLQLSIVFIVVLSFGIIGMSSVFYIKKLNDRKNKEALDEKTHSILVELQQNLSNTESITPLMSNEINSYLRNLYNIYFTDINLFNINGELISTTRKELYDEGLVSKWMNPIAYNELYSGKKSRLIINESIGKMEFLSAYIPFRNNQNKIIAYLNLPYFTRQNEMQQGITTFITAFINIFIFLTGLSIIFALIISKYVTRPLQLITTSLGTLALNHKNKKIEWNRDDEIGSLIAEYNRLIDELEKSVQKLAQSERESAWREMARQVAHEIKNPLTPMKLSTQYLLKSWNEHAPDIDLRINNFMNNLIEQIENLSNIASEFSDFAQMPKTFKEKLDLVNIINNSAEIFKEIENITLTFEYDTNTSFNIVADKKQMLRVFNNLLNNALQSIAKDKKGLIKIKLYKNNGFNVITVEDNGKGIEEDQKSKIFMPDFSTKSGSMGLGLAIVKNIIENAGGEITFESETGKGTVFIIKLPENI